MSMCVARYCQSPFGRRPWKGVLRQWPYGPRQNPGGQPLSAARNSIWYPPRGRGPVYGVSRQWPHGPRHQPGPHPSAALAGPVAINEGPMTRAPASARPIPDFNIFKLPFLFFIEPDGQHEAVRSRYVRRANGVVWGAPTTNTGSIWRHSRSRYLGSAGFGIGSTRGPFRVAKFRTGAKLKAVLATGRGPVAPPSTIQRTSRGQFGL